MVFGIAFCGPCAEEIIDAVDAILWQCRLHAAAIVFSDVQLEVLDEINESKFLPLEDVIASTAICYLFLST